MSAKFNRPAPIIVGKVGSLEVKKVDATAVPCLVIERHWLSANKIKAVLANSDACKAFLAQYDKPAEKPKATGPAVDHNALAKQLAAFQAKLDSLTGATGTPAGNGGRFDVDTIKPAAPAAPTV